MVAWPIHTLAYSDVLLSTLIGMLEAGKSGPELLTTYQNWLKQVPYPDPPQE